MHIWRYGIQKFSDLVMKRPGEMIEGTGDAEVTLCFVKIVWICGYGVCV